MSLSADNGTTVKLRQNRAEFHGGCVICRPNNSRGLKIDFTAAGDLSVEAVFNPGPEHCGYKGFLHGGITASLLDSAMTNCLFAHDIPAFTAELLVKYKKPVICGIPITIRGWREKAMNPLHILKGEIIQSGQVVTTAEAKFMETERFSAKSN